MGATPRYAAASDQEKWVLGRSMGCVGRVAGDDAVCGQERRRASSGPVRESGRAAGRDGAHGEGGGPRWCSREGRRAAMEGRRAAMEGRRAVGGCVPWGRWDGQMGLARLVGRRQGHRGERFWTASRQEGDEEGERREWRVESCTPKPTAIDTLSRRESERAYPFGFVDDPAVFGPVLIELEKDDHECHDALLRQWREIQFRSVVLNPLFLLLHIILFPFACLLHVLEIAGCYQETPSAKDPPTEMYRWRKLTRVFLTPSYLVIGTRAAPDAPEHFVCRAHSRQSQFVMREDRHGPFKHEGREFYSVNIPPLGVAPPRSSWDHYCFPVRSPMICVGVSNLREFEEWFKLLHQVAMGNPLAADQLATRQAELGDAPAFVAPQPTAPADLYPPVPKTDDGPPSYSQAMRDHRESKDARLADLDPAQLHDFFEARGLASAAAKVKEHEIHGDKLVRAAEQAPDRLAQLFGERDSAKIIEYIAADAVVGM